MKLSTVAGPIGPGLRPARVCAAFGERFCVRFDGCDVPATASGGLAHAAGTAADLPVAGDFVLVQFIHPGLALIEQVLPRRSKIARRAAGRRNEEQVLAANVDLALLVCGLDGDYNVRRLERYLAICADGGVAPVVVLNKADTCGDLAASIDQARQVAGTVPVRAVSAKTGAGCEVLGALLTAGLTAVLLGSSGAGKSTLLNRLLGADVRATAPVRASDARGRHTTTARELVELPNGAAVIDTPGLREIQLWVDAAAVTAVFDDIAELAAECRFRDCTHTVEPGCAVRSGVDGGRLQSFHKLTREAARHDNPASEKQRWRSIHKAARRFQQMRDRERDG